MPRDNLTVTLNDGRLQMIYSKGALRLYGGAGDSNDTGATGFAVPDVGSSDEDFLYILPRGRALSGLKATWQIDEDLQISFKDPEAHIAPISLSAVGATYVQADINNNLSLIQEKINAIFVALENFGVVQKNAIIITPEYVSAVCSTDGPSTLTAAPATSRVETNHVWPNEPSVRLSTVDPTVVIT